MITFDEFKAWVYHVIEHAETYPSYLFDILDCESKSDYTRNMLDLLGFAASWGEGPEEDAMDGIGYLRFDDFDSDAVSKRRALAALEKHPEVMQQFRRSFPFITI